MSTRKPTHIPELARDYSRWPCPDVNIFMDEKERNRFEKLRQAICMRIDGVSLSQIQLATTVPRGEVSRYLRRCLNSSSSGEILGFFALVKYKRVAPYRRTKRVVHTQFSGSAGCAGALQLLFDEHREAKEFIDKIFLADPEGEETNEAFTSKVDLHAGFLQFLEKEIGIDSSMWPFNTDNRGFKSLCDYCEKLVDAFPERWVRCRCGKKAGWRLKTGKGGRQILIPLRPMIYMEMDFLKEDAAGIVEIRDPFGGMHAIPVARWYVGVIAEQYTGGIFGYCITLELIRARIVHWKQFSVFLIRNLILSFSCLQI